MRAEQILWRPVVTEKSSLVRDANNEFVFAVDPRANKGQIRHAVETLFSVRVQSVRTLRMPRKLHRVGARMGYRPRWKKALVRLAPGHAIEFFEGV